MKHHNYKHCCDASLGGFQMRNVSICQHDKMSSTSYIPWSFHQAGSFIFQSYRKLLCDILLQLQIRLNIFLTPRAESIIKEAEIDLRKQSLNEEMIYLCKAKPVGGLAPNKHRSTSSSHTKLDPQREREILSSSNFLLSSCGRWNLLFKIKCFFVGNYSRNQKAACCWFIASVYAAESLILCSRSGSEQSQQLFRDKFKLLINVMRSSKAKATVNELIRLISS